ncbi:hypothetical protein LTR62_000761 [Meristemomyces frigidus]|uniref:BTB domain-containing protein n=1 Tax=Meristemomyces frigidus TaxID=1508187 RepID=A0AAN7TKT9_9PEZI|nr:hypothetical protein LTR62_000761 [Meristemomyces frigidus]
MNQDQPENANCLLEQVSGLLARSSEELQTKEYVQQKYSDFQLKHKSKSWIVHKFVLCAQCEYFRAALDAKMKEAKENCILVCEENDPKTVDAVLSFLYTRNYGDHGKSETDQSPILLDVRVFILVDVYLINSLSTKAAGNFKKRAEAGWTHTR